MQTTDRAELWGVGRDTCKIIDVVLSIIYQQQQPNRLHLLDSTPNLSAQGVVESGTHSHTQPPKNSYII